MAAQGLLRRGGRVMKDAGRWRLAGTALLLLLALFVAGWNWSKPLGGAGSQREGRVVTDLFAEPGGHQHHAARERQ